MCIAAMIAALGSNAVASPLFELVGGAHGMGGFNARVTGGSAASTYFNPALLVDAEQGLDLGTMMLSDQIGITLHARAGATQCGSGGCDVPAVFGTGPESFRHGDGSPLTNPTVPTDWLENGLEPTNGEGGLTARPRQGAGTGQNVRAYQLVGLVTPVLRKRVMLGLYAMIPLSEFTTAKAFYNDEREQYFSNSLHPELYSDRLTATSLAFGAATRINDKLAVGMTFTLSLRNSAAAPVYVSDLSNLDAVLLDSDIGVQASVAPHFGIAYDPIDRLRVTATVHTRQAFEIETGFDYILSTGNEQGASIGFTHSFMPLTIATGASWDLGAYGPHRLSVVGTAVFGRWSTYRDRHSERPHPDYAWSDTLSGSLGLRHQRAALASYLDVTYQPSPVPAQTGRSNYVDNDRVGIAGGLQHRFTLRGYQFRAGAHAQFHRLLHRSVTKFSTPLNPQPNPNEPGYGDNHFPQLVVDEVPDDAVDGVLGDPIPGREGLQTNNPGFPGFESSGWILGAGISISLLY